MPLLTPTAYVVPADLANHGLPATVLASASTPQQQAACDFANGLVDAAFRARYGALPSAWGPEVVGYAGALAADHLLTHGLGKNPASPFEKSIADDAKEANDWLAELAVGRAQPAATVTAAVLAPSVASAHDPRGW